MATSFETATLAGGCFWCLEAVFTQLRGVQSVVSGYAGGGKVATNYQEVCAGHADHAEVVQVVFDPAVLSYRDLVGIFFASHDPTTRDRQGNDVGRQYRSAIYFHAPEQERTAKEVIRDLEQKKLFAAPIVTEVAPLDAFFPAEVYHQRYYENNPNQPYCSFVITPKVAKFRKQFADRLR